MLAVAAEDIYPRWSDSENNLDPRLDKLLEDIISDHLVPGFWATTNKMSKKKRVLDDRTSKLEKPKKPKKQKMELEISSNVQDNTNVTQELIKLVGTLVDEVQNLQKNQQGFQIGFAEMVKAKLEGLEHRSEQGGGHAKHANKNPATGSAKDVEENVSSSKKTGEKEDDGASCARTPVGTHSEIARPNDHSFETPSWSVKDGEPGSDGLPVKKVVKNVGRSGKGQHQDQSIDDVVVVTEQQEHQSDQGSGQAKHANKNTETGSAPDVEETVSSSKKTGEKEDDGASSQTPATASARTQVGTPPEITRANDHSSETPSCLVKDGEPGSDGLPVKDVVKNVGRSGKAQHQDQSIEDVVAVTEQPEEENLKMASPSGSMTIVDENEFQSWQKLKSRHTFLTRRSNASSQG